MNKIGIFYGTEKGMTEAMAQVMYRVLGYHFTRSHSVIDNKFVGLVLDHHTQPEMTKTRITGWLDQVKPELLEKIN